jgi:hypothetical protein
LIAAGLAKPDADDNCLDGIGEDKRVGDLVERG